LQNSLTLRSKPFPYVYVRKIHKEGRWVPHELSEDNKNRRRDTALTLLSKFWKKDFFHKIITGDEKWIFYEVAKEMENQSQWSNFV